MKQRRRQIPIEEKGKNSHITPLALYQTLYAHRDEPVLLLDDIEHIYKQEVSVGILRSALWGKKMAGGRRQRTVTYSTTKNINVPDRFEYKGGVIIIGNKIPREDDPLVEALLTRLTCVKFPVTPEDVYDFMRQVMVRRKGYSIWDGKRQQERWIPRKECERVIDELEERHITDLRKLEHALIVWTDFKRKPDRLARELDNLAQTAVSVQEASQRPQERAREVFLEIINTEGISENEKAWEQDETGDQNQDAGGGHSEGVSGSGTYVETDRVERISSESGEETSCEQPRRRSVWACS